MPTVAPETVIPTTKVSATPATTTTQPPTTTLDVTFTVATHGLHPGALAGSGEYFGSGCSPGSALLPDGVWYGFAREYTPSEITFDLACLGWVPDPNDDAIEEGHWEIVNNNPRVRVVPIIPGAQVTCLWAGCPANPFPYTDWVQEPHDLLPLEEDHGGLAMWIYINDGFITEVGRERLAG
jgi:hypothetical protein